MNGAAEISPCGNYRYFLARWWTPVVPTTARTMAWVMCNPSTADASVNDSTVRSCMRIAKHNDFDGIWIVNLFAYRARNPKDLLTADVPLNDEMAIRYLDGSLQEFPLVVLGWGDAGKKAPGFAEARDHVMRQFVFPRQTQVRAIGYTAAGNPGHPLYAKTDAPLLSGEANWRNR